MTTVKISAGACGFVTLVKANKGDKRTVCIEMESDCDSVADLACILEQMDPLGLKEILSTNPGKNRVFQVATEKLPHSACPVPVAIIKAAEVALGLNVPSSVSIEFECEPEDES
ncbi:DUF6951 family protein [Desulfomonile tiedjei]|uniref:Uncharacterized protein n=1 Tax=Desulfomonile tiedjei (strain ATCC 49306 / DSM 6799 / DCB-1) TaxID=706587 RepID=I4C203_DESTA|nr:hypothetical protein [Desulfomonile tiedjei]AFM23594.1 hypothetical protein Desti_0871 [Desulfomonile tiedjei DSM 6799]